MKGKTQGFVESCVSLLASNRKSQSFYKLNDSVPENQINLLKGIHMFLIESIIECFFDAIFYFSPIIQFFRIEDKLREALIESVVRSVVRSGQTLK